ncbi:bifunctional biotin--[acetyl-CoA-carboxylase] ligase/biotin operon repressor BirA [Pseudomonas typographi]|uniref:bifunctional biotin--[acetyl-CoA-carboxylase] ligase/biotin operon repressor BirA n=1 Tax=Pseudomonas typographi TaxID=2715964 RepID=UPI00168272B9|nr:bifunctional biotin--[acetyl-CoA-carboxylase] ligase/biotin operon repressor BirA [Pseudomonas typographi]MBD1552992.1 bifunctional biotin--[acetyl-CoA-carboxylase] ligase/biotin operon repressor BirA [Pseudomonas typographi]MBD1588481.1 bifunctional biotin--[acetyl-CoA-carboxylase] ligase/biotin operon repressor BirA [Pseudomonas typographi]
MLALLKLLADGRFHSGEALGQVLGVSRSAVWKQLQQLEADYQVQVHKVRGRGYCLAAPLALLDAEQLQPALGAQGITLDLHATIDSTNARALRLIAEQAPLPCLVLAECQLAGRGRRGRQWVSPFGENLYYSLALRIDGGMRRIEGLSLVAGLAVLACLKEAGVPDVVLKWPNDVLVGDRKIAGILLELVGDPADICHVVLGVGINVNMKAAPAVDQLWTSMQLSSGQPMDRNLLVLALSRHLLHYLQLHRDHGFAALREQWEQHHAWQGRHVTLQAGSRATSGKVLGVDDHGGLRLSVEGEEQVFSGGELSLRLRDDS